MASRYRTSSAAYSSCAGVSGRFDQSVRVCPLGMRHIQQCFHQFRVADLGFHADACRCDLRIEDRRHHLLGR